MNNCYLSDNVSARNNDDNNRNFPLSHSLGFRSIFHKVFSRIFTPRIRIKQLGFYSIPIAGVETFLKVVLLEKGGGDCNKLHFQQLAEEATRNVRFQCCSLPTAQVLREICDSDMRDIRVLLSLSLWHRLTLFPPASLSMCTLQYRQLMAEEYVAWVRNFRVFKESL